MNDETPEATARPGSARKWLDNRRLVGAVAAVTLVAGIVVFALGRGAASGASDKLAQAHRQLRAQQVATTRSRRCEQTLRGSIPRVVSDAQAVLGSATQLGGQDQQLVSAEHDAQAAGAQGNIDNYNNAVDRANGAVSTGNAIIATANQQKDTLTKDGEALATVCG